MTSPGHNDQGQAAAYEPPADDEVGTVLAEHAPHLLESWRLTRALHRDPDYLRSLADCNEQAKPVAQPLSMDDLFLRYKNPTKADRLAAAERLRDKAAGLIQRADEIEREVAADA